MEKRCINSIS